MTADDANRYYEACIKASEALMNDSPYSLHKPNPANPEEAARNYQEIFEDPSTAPEEVIFAKGMHNPVLREGTVQTFGIIRTKQLTVLLIRDVRTPLSIWQIFMKL